MVEVSRTDSYIVSVSTALLQILWHRLDGRSRSSWTKFDT